MRGWLGMGLAASQPTMVQQNSCSKYELFKAAVNCHLHFVKREFSKHKFSSNLIVAVLKKCFEIKRSDSRLVIFFLWLWQYIRFPFSLHFFHSLKSCYYYNLFFFCIFRLKTKNAEVLLQFITWHISVYA